MIQRLVLCCLIKSLLTRLRKAYDVTVVALTLTTMVLKKEVSYDVFLKYLVQFVSDARPKKKEQTIRISRARVLTSGQVSSILEECEVKRRKKGIIARTDEKGEGGRAEEEKSHSSREKGSGSREEGNGSSKGGRETINK